MRVRVHKDTRHRGQRPNRCWCIIPQGAHRVQLVAQAEIVLLRDAEFKCSPREEDWLDGWTVGEILWVHDPIRRADASMTADVMALTSGDLEAAPEEGWRKLTFIHGLGFGTGSTREEVKQNLSDHVAWLMLTPFGDYAIRD